jgi:hypothetical protein
LQRFNGRKNGAENWVPYADGYEATANEDLEEQSAEIGEHSRPMVSGPWGKIIALIPAPTTGARYQGAKTAAVTNRTTIRN